MAKKKLSIMISTKAGDDSWGTNPLSQAFYSAKRTLTASLPVEADAFWGINYELVGDEIGALRWLSHLLFSEGN
jgi:hypothetical protein